MSLMRIVKQVFSGGEQAQPEPTPAQKVKQAAGEHRERNNEILNALEEIPFPAPGSKEEENFSGEELEKMKNVVASCKNLMTKAEPSALDTRDIDRNILKIIEEFTKALEHGDAKAAHGICRCIGTAVIDLRREIKGSSPEAIKEELEDRASRTEQMVAVSELQNKMFGLRQTIRNYDRKLEELKPLYQEAYEQVQEIKKKFPELELAVEEGILNRQKIGGLEIQYNTQKGKAADLYNEIDRLRKLRGNTNADIHTIETTIETVEQTLMQTEVRINQELMDRIAKVQEEYKRQLLNNAQTMQQLEEVNQKFSAILESFWQSSPVLDRMIRNDLQYAEMVQKQEQAKQLREEAIRRQNKEALEKQKKQQELENAQKEQSLQNGMLQENGAQEHTPQRQTIEI